MIETKSSVEWVANGKILYVRQEGTSSRAEIDAIFDQVIKAMQTWPSEQPLLLLWDSSHLERVSWSPHIRKRIGDFLTAFDSRGKIAAVVKKSPVTQIIKNFLEWELNRRYKHREHRLFYTVEDAVIWLEKSI